MTVGMIDSIKKHGGKRDGAGRPKGTKANHTVEAESARAYVIKRITEELEPIVTKHIELAKAGDRQGLEYLINQGIGKPRETMEVTVDATLKLDV